MDKRQAQIILQLLLQSDIRMQCCTFNEITKGVFGHTNKCPRCAALALLEE